MSFFEYAILILSIALGICNIVYAVILARRTRLIVSNNKAIKDLNRTLFVGTGKNNSVMARVLIALEKYDDAFNCHGAQLKHINHYLIEVLQISNLLNCENIEIDNTDLIEVLRERIKWYKEVERLRSQDEFYEGD